MALEATSTEMVASSELVQRRSRCWFFVERLSLMDETTFRIVLTVVWGIAITVLIGFNIAMKLRLKDSARLCRRWLSGTEFCTCSMCGSPTETGKERVAKLRAEVDAEMDEEMKRRGLT